MRQFDYVFESFITQHKLNDSDNGYVYNYIIFKVKQKFYLNIYNNNGTISQQTPNSNTFPTKYENEDEDVVHR